MAKIRFIPSRKEAVLDERRSILELAQAHGIGIRSTCGGRQRCGECRIVIEASSAPLPEPSSNEREVLGSGIETGYRLACDTVLCHDVTVRIPEESRPERQVILTAATNHAYPATIRSGLKPYAVRVDPPALPHVVADRERLLGALETTHGLKGLTMDCALLNRLPRIIRQGEGHVRAVIRNGCEIVDVSSGAPEHLAGIAFDLGTTTVVAYLMDLENGRDMAVASAMNPQIPFGDDVISRISFCGRRSDGLDTLRNLIIQCLNELVETTCREADIEPGQILEATAVGNSAMHHICMGIDPTHLATAPYTPALQASQEVKARDLDLDMGASAYVHFLPLKAGFVGSDTVACVLATRMHKSKIPTLLIDLGTNGEIVLGNKTRLMCCSTAAGPAFEGGYVRFGMRAAPGAVERLHIDPQTWHVHVETIEGKPARGLCGSGLVSAVAELIRTGVLLEKGNFNEEVDSPRLRQGGEGMEFVLMRENETGIEEDLIITRRDISELQMAKAAVYAGIMVLRQLSGDPDIKRVLLAGAGGSRLDPEDARTIGLLPVDLDADAVAVGNAAIHGACLTLLDVRSRREAERIARKMTYQELASHEAFQELFVSGMLFQNAVDAGDGF
ncbi:MAG: ASKHA domain-containing protein [Deltaproteobacteria bacterium]|nr:ASKHA domain-containing protein [Deltaproteobacteria bacterium]